MREELLKRLLPITEEERKILEEKKEIQKDIYTATEEFTIDSRKMLEKEIEAEEKSMEQE